MPTLTVAAASWLPDTWVWEAMLQLVMAAVLGGLIGMERQYRGRAAGFRTHLLVCVGCCLVMITSVAFPRVYLPDFPDDQNIIRIDPARLAYSVMGGIGFVGAGAILKSGLAIRGLTTAASLWCVAAVGLALGLGLYWIAVFTGLLVLFSLLVLSLVEERIPSRWFRSICVVCDDKPEDVERIRQTIRGFGLQIREMSFTRDLEAGRLTLRFQVAYTDRRLTPKISKDLLEHKGLTAIELL